MLALTQMATFLFWMPGLISKTPLTSKIEPLCWQFLPGCEGFQLNQSLLGFVLYLMLFTAITSALGFVSQKIELGYWTLAISVIFKLVIYLQDYRFMGNYHYMQYWLLVIFLLMPFKQKLLPLMIVSFYLAAASLKFNVEWLSGSALLNDTFLTGRSLEIACAYVIVLETLIVWWLLSKNNLIFYLGLFQFVVFHLFSYLVVGFYYPLIMLAFLSYLIARRYFNENQGSVFPPGIWGTALLVLFFTFQLVPQLQSTRPDLFGFSRLTALSMLDSKSICQITYLAEFTDGFRELPRLYTNSAGEALSTRVRCSPVVVMSEAKHHCARQKIDPEFKTLKVTLLSRRFSDPQFLQVFEINDFCKATLEINFWGSVQ